MALISKNPIMQEAQARKLTLLCDSVLPRVIFWPLILLQSSEQVTEALA